MPPLVATLQALVVELRAGSPAPSLRSSPLPSSRNRAPVSGWQVGRCGATGVGADCSVRISRRNPAGMDDWIRPHFLLIKIRGAAHEGPGWRGWGDFRCPEPDTCRHRSRSGRMVSARHGRPWHAMAGPESATGGGPGLQAP